MGRHSPSGDDLDAEPSLLTGEGVEWIDKQRHMTESANDDELATSVLMFRHVVSILLQKLGDDSVYNRLD